ncbi:MAG: hypothetical protein HYX61_11185 [Gammaproteobacteria bacterium]|nr:hypothetical protein [Gammaproteobacteria bacterium]
MKRSAKSTEQLRKKRKVESEVMPKIINNTSLSFQRACTFTSKPELDIPLEDFDTSCTTIALLIKQHLQIEISASLRLFMTQLNKFQFAMMSNEQKSYQCHLIVLLNRYIKTKWPPGYTGLITQNDILKAYIGAAIVSSKLVCEEAIWNEDLSKEILRILQLSVMKSISASISILMLHDSAGLNKIEAEFLRILDWKVNLFAGAAQADLLLLFSKNYNQFYSSAMTTKETKGVFFTSVKEGKELFESKLQHFGELDAHKPKEKSFSKS